jgi:glycosyltransferase involved in cell wall biosynthesis
MVWRGKYLAYHASEQGVSRIRVADTVAFNTGQTVGQRQNWRQIDIRSKLKSKTLPIYLRMPQRIKLLLLIPHLGGGGAEKVTSHLARHLDKSRFEIHLCLFTKDKSGSQPIPTWVRVTRFEVRRVRHGWLQLIRLIRAQQPDVILSSMAHLNFLLLILRPFLPSNARILVRQNTTASAVARTWLASLPYRYLYHRADAIVCQSEAMANDLDRNFGLPRSKLKVLANPVHLTSLQTERDSGSQNWPSDATPRLLSIGRLATEKGLDLLLRAVHQIRPQYPHIHLQILGSGPEAAFLAQLTAELGLATAVSFAGYRDDLATFYPHATLFVLPSRHEGMPNALLEAAAAGLPIVATPCAQGVSDLLREAPGAWLAEAISAEALATAILTALADLARRPDARPRFQHAFLSPFATSTAIAAYAALIEQSAAKKLS